MPKVVINLSPPRGRISVTPSWTMSLFEKAKAMPCKKKFVDKILHFELTPGAISFAKSAFPGAQVIGDVTKRLKLADGPRRNFVTAYEPTDLQVEARNRSRGKELFAFFEKPGSGKTKMCLDHAVDAWCAGEIDGAFVFSYAGVHEQWILDEAPKHLHKDIPFLGVTWWAGKKLDERIFNPDSNVFRLFAMNYESYAVSDKGFAAARRFAESGSMMAIADESQRLKSDDSVISQRAVDHREDWSQRVIASGEPTPLGLEDYYRQFCFLDPSIIGCHTFQGFKAMFCRMGGFENQKVIGYHNQEILHEKMAPYVHVGAPNIDAEQVYEISRFNLGSKAREAYEQLKQEMMVEVERAAEMEEEALGSGDQEMLQEVFYIMRSVLPMQAKLNQITCGRLTNPDGDVIEFGDERLQMLSTLLDIRPTQKSIVWSVFKDDHVRQGEMLGDKAAIFNGDTPKKQRREIITEFLDPTSKLQYLLASKAAAGTGLNLQGTCHWNIYYSDNSNAGQRWQSEMRTYRLGVEQDVLYQDIIARSTVNVGIYNSNKRKRDISDMSVAEFKFLMEEQDILDGI